MARKTLILNGSPRPHGNTAHLIEELKTHLRGEVVELSAFRSYIAPCVDCRGCWESATCVVRDEMDVIYGDDFDNFVIASPVYFGTLPGAVLSVMSRMQPWHVAKFFLDHPKELRAKKAGVILTGGGKGNEERAYHHLMAFFRMVNARDFRHHMVCSLRTDTLPAQEDTEALSALPSLAQWLNSDDPTE